MATVGLQNPEDLGRDVAAWFHVGSESGWLLFNYVSRSQIKYVDGGANSEEGIHKLAHQGLLEDDQVQYVLVRIGGIQEKGTLKTTTRDIFLVWNGPGLSILERGKKTEALGSVKELIRNYVAFHADLLVTNKANLNLETILDRSHPLSGSHVID